MDIIMKSKNVELTKSFQRLCGKEGISSRGFRRDSVNAQVVISAEKGLQIAEVTMR